MNFIVGQFEMSPTEALGNARDDVGKLMGMVTWIRGSLDIFHNHRQNRKDCRAVPQSAACQRSWLSCSIIDAGDYLTRDVPQPSR